MARILYQSAIALVLLSGVAFASAPAFANDFSEEGDFRGTYSYIGPGASSFPEMALDITPYGPEVTGAPDVAVGAPVAAYDGPDASWAPIDTEVQINVDAE